MTQKHSLVIVQGHLVSEGVLLLGHQHFYICENFTLSSVGDVYCTRHCLSKWVPLLPAGSALSFHLPFQPPTLQPLPHYCYCGFRFGPETGPCGETGKPEGTSSHDCGSPRLKSGMLTERQLLTCPELECTSDKDDLFLHYLGDWVQTNPLTHSTVCWLLILCKTAPSCWVRPRVNQQHKQSDGKSLENTIILGQHMTGSTHQGSHLVMWG